MDPKKLAELLQIALGALADIAFSEDMDPETIRHKARRIYEEISPRFEAQLEGQDRADGED
jgi:hypothetical protein